MWQKIFQNKAAIAIVAGICIFTAFPKLEWIPLIFLFPVFFTYLTFLCKGFWSGFRYGFLTSFIVMLGGFYWVVYVIHVFGYLPWSVSTMIYMGFCGFGALNFPLFAGITSWFHQKYKVRSLPNPIQFAWFCVGLPALFTIIEFLIPKLFPWYIGHGLYRALWLNQIVELTGSSLLSFFIYSTGCTLFLLFTQKREKSPIAWKLLGVPVAILLICVSFSLYRLNTSQPEGRTLRVALVQANIGSLEKVKARAGIIERVNFVVNRYKSLTNKALASKPQLIIWPETAMPFQILEGRGKWSKDLYETVNAWQVPLLTGAYAPTGSYAYRGDYNAAFLLEPTSDSSISTQVYKKNVLLAFGEYMPLGKTFPILYKWFPAVSNFWRGTEQKGVAFQDGTKFGVTICYEAIVPSFYRKVIRHKVHAVINLTNDSWFGPTVEPYQHGALSVFRAIETRVPLIRVANTGTSFTVDDRGRMSRQTPIYAEDVLISDLTLPRVPPQTFYIRWGEWFIWLCGIVLALLLFLIIRKNHASISR